MRLGRGFENPQPAEVGRGDARRFRRKRANGDQLRVRTGQGIDAAGYPGHRSRGHRRLELKIGDPRRGNVFGAGDAVVIREHIDDVGHSPMVEPARCARVVGSRAMWKTAPPGVMAAANAGAGRGLDMSRAPALRRTYCHCAHSSERKMSMSRGRGSGERGPTARTGHVPRTSPAPDIMPLCPLERAKNEHVPRGGAGAGRILAGRPPVPPAPGEHGHGDACDAEDPDIARGVADDQAFACFQGGPPAGQRVTEDSAYRRRDD